MKNERRIMKKMKNKSPLTSLHVTAAHSHIHGRHKNTSHTTNCSRIDVISVSRQGGIRLLPKVQISRQSMVSDFKFNFLLIHVLVYLHHTRSLFMPLSLVKEALCYLKVNHKLITSVMLLSHFFLSALFFLQPRVSW